MEFDSSEEKEDQEPDIMKVIKEFDSFKEKEDQVMKVIN